MAAEIIIGLAAHSLALISDAAHMLTDAASIGLVLITMRLAARPPRGRYTYGLKRTEILSAQANGITLIVLALWLAYEAIRRLINPPAVAGGAVIVVALAGIAVNVATTMFVGRASRAPNAASTWRARSGTCSPTCTPSSPPRSPASSSLPPGSSGPTRSPR